MFAKKILSFGFQGTHLFFLLKSGPLALILMRELLKPTTGRMHFYIMGDVSPLHSDCAR